MRIQFILAIYENRWSNDKNKLTYSLRLSSYSFFDCWHSAKPMTLKILGFQFISTVLWKIEHNCMPESFFIADISEVGRKNTFLILWFLIPSRPKWSKIFP